MRPMLVRRTWVVNMLAIRRIQGSITEYGWYEVKKILSPLPLDFFCTCNKGVKARS